MSPDDLVRIHDAIQATRKEPLHDWVAVAIWHDADGHVTVHGSATPLQLKGYLHSGLWAVAHQDERVPEGLETQSLDDTADARSFSGGRMDLVKIGGATIGRGSFEPGWRWSESVKPIVGTESCGLAHMGYVVSGRMGIRMDGGEEFEIAEGDAIRIAPGHDAWTIGDEPCIVLEIQAAREYATPSD